jgi:hypothetical protein
MLILTRTQQQWCHEKYNHEWLRQSPDEDLWRTWEEFATTMLASLTEVMASTSRSYPIVFCIGGASNRRVFETDGRTHFGQEKCFSSPGNMHRYWCLPRHVLVLLTMVFKGDTREAWTSKSLETANRYGCSVASRKIKACSSTWSSLA